MRKLLLLVFVLLYTLGVSAQNAPATIQGIVTDSKNTPVSMVTVAIEGTDKGTHTDASGYYQLNNITSGTYVLRVGGVGYNTIRKEVSLADNQILKLDINISASQHTLNEVIVSASRSVEALDETPASVHVLDSRTVQLQTQINSNISNILAATVPGLALQSNSTSNVGQTLRGRNVLIMVDGIPQSTPLRNGSRDVRTIDPAAIERVEVVKGATAVYGNGADGGLINYITKQPNTDKPFSAYTSVAGTGMLFNSKNTLGGRISQQFSGKIKGFDYVASGTYEKTGVLKDGEGLVISPLYGLGETKMYNGFSKLGYNINDNHRVEAMYNYFGSLQDTEYVLQNGKYGETPSIGVKGEVKGIEEGTRYNHNAQLRYTGKNLFLNSTVDVSAYMQNFYTVYGWTTYFKDGGQSTILSDKKGLRVNLNTPFQINNDIKAQLTYGVDYMNDVTSQPLVDGRTWVPEMDLHNLAPYAQLQLNLYNDFIFKAGYRYDNVKISVDDFQQLVLASGAGGDYVNGGTLKFDANTYNFGLRYAGIQAFKPFISYSQGFSMIDVGRYVRGAKEDYISQMNLEPVIVNNYEAGFHSKLGKFAFSGAYFVSTSKLGANLKANDEGTYSIERAPERIEGFEALVDFFVTSKLTIGANAAYSEGKIDFDDNGEYFDDADRYLNSTRIPPVKVTSYINIKPIAKLNINLQHIYSGERDRFEPNAKGNYVSGEGPIKSFNVFNLASTYQATEKLNLNLGIENLLNESYYLPQAYWYGRNDYFTRANGARFQLGASYKW
ncbi:TonB-dependent receptor [Pontibacter cellulosilyticus]|uniref:TonB-dependent receptor n=1 Tax=Pontibacter cellulosilyticus TaxID=1720253 RepID=A0A923N7M1_9BACT|nr:TonB-dependent receptor [Pontibacter cellulosilyticus]MBC5993254.1 TonB-dependent receptor [Pontibacter cellulosilyticus]